MDNSIIVFPGNTKKNRKKPEVIEMKKKTIAGRLTALLLAVLMVTPLAVNAASFTDVDSAVYWWAEKALFELEESDYERLYKNSVEENYLTHGEYNYHNILVTSEGLATTNFDKCKRNVQAEDIYYYLRKAMEKHSWNVRLCDCIINAYCAIRPLSVKEVEYIKIRLLYPEKFWKITDSYYRSNKAWMSVKNIEKLKMTIAQMEEKKELLRSIFGVAVS